MVGEGEEDDRRADASGGYKLAPRLLLQTLKTSVVGRASGLTIASDTQRTGLIYSCFLFWPKKAFHGW